MRNTQMGSAKIIGTELLTRIMTTLFYHESTLWADVVSGTILKVDAKKRFLLVETFPPRTVVERIAWVDFSDATTYYNFQNFEQLKINDHITAEVERRCRFGPWEARYVKREREPNRLSKVLNREDRESVKRKGAKNEKVYAAFQ